MRLTNYLNTGKLMFGQFILTNVKPENIEDSLMTTQELTEPFKVGLKNDKVNKSSTKTLKVQCTHVINNTVFIAPSITRATRYVKSYVESSGDKSRKVGERKISKLALTPTVIYKGW